MIVQSPATSAFRNFVTANSAFWQARLLRQPPRGTGYVLVDLLHNNGSVLQLNLLLARYVADVVGADVAAFVAPTFTNYPVPVREVVDLANSFGVTKIFYLNCTDGRPRSMAERIVQQIRLLTTSMRLNRHRGANLRARLLEQHLLGVHVGDLIFDSYLDITRRATIEEFDSRLRTVLARALRFGNDFAQILSTEKIRALIVSHPVYVDYGLPLRLCLARGIPVYGKVWLDPIGIRLYEHPDEAHEFAGMPVAPALAYFRERLGSTLTKRADAYFPPAPNKSMSLDYLRYGYGTDKTELTREELLTSLSIDRAKKTCLIMAQQFSDAPHCYPDMLFDDYFQWLDETLSFAATQPQINWLVRQHPYEIMVGETEFFKDIAKRHLGEGSAIKLVPNSATTSSLFRCVDAVTTVIGSGGIEFASVGIPCILAGNPFYGDFDFAVRPRSKATYFETLESIPKLERLSAQQIATAKELALVYLSYKRVSSNRVPFISDLGGRKISQDELDKYWDDSSGLLETRLPEDDPLYRCVSKMIAERHKSLVNFFVD
jgi:hypothetical protein